MPVTGILAITPRVGFRTGHSGRLLRPTAFDVTQVGAVNAGQLGRVARLHDCVLGIVMCLREVTGIG